MDKSYEKLFDKLDAIKPADDLLGKIMLRVRKEEKKKIMLQLIIFSLSSLGSLISIIATFFLVKVKIIESGFDQFFSLIFSDLHIVLMYWQNYAFTLLETLPINSLLLFLASLLIFVVSARIIIKDFKKLHSPLPGLSQLKIN